MNLSIPKELFLTKGVGTHREQLHSFELALRNPGIEKCNLAQVPSIMPPDSKIISRTESLKRLRPGAITFFVMSRGCFHPLTGYAPGSRRPSTKTRQTGKNRKEVIS